jgi:hypothetical protein
VVRQKRFRESPSSACQECPFYDNSCNVPGGTCAYRAIGGVPGRYVGDVLEDTGQIKSGWDNRKEKRE